MISNRKAPFRGFFIKTTPENPVLWTGMKGASAESRKNNLDAETSSDLMIEKEWQVSSFRI
jgi:hypothetical protein